jgi:pimeloyl-ACP methyl ester carboxylesterase
MDVEERTVRVNGQPCRVWEKGHGDLVGFLAGLGGVPRWSPFLDRLAEKRRVVVPSLPGFPGALGHDQLDDVADWVSATLDLLDAAGLDGADLIGESVGGMLAAEVACFSRASVGRLVLVAPFGIFDPREPTADVFAVKQDELSALLSVHPERVREQAAPPEGEDPAEWSIVVARAGQAAARLLWPLGDRGLAKRLHRISAPTLIVWGRDDRVIPAGYARKIAQRIRGASVREIAGAGHLVDLDAPDELARSIEDFLLLSAAG